MKNEKNIMNKLKEFEKRMKIVEKELEIDEEDENNEEIDREWVVKRLEIIRDNLVHYPDSWLESKDRPRPCICWPDGSDLGMGMASHMTGDPGGFKLLGFKGYHDFYLLPKNKRNEFLKKGIKLFAKFFPDCKVKGKTDELEGKREKFENELNKLAKKYYKYKRKKYDEEEEKRKWLKVKND